MVESEFHRNLEKAYVGIEKELNLYRDRYPKKDILSYLDQEGASVLELPESWSPGPLAEHRYFSRVVIPVGEGYVVKIRPLVTKSFCYFVLLPIQNRNQRYIEEESVGVLRKQGFTHEDGFWVPEHKVVGVSLVEGRIKVDPEGYGLTISEDLTENQQYEVVEILPELFPTLENEDSFRSDYQRHIAALTELYANPNIRPTINRHTAPTNPLRAIERMLLARVREDVGEIVIGDLDNLIFDEIES